MDWRSPVARFLFLFFLFYYLFLDRQASQTKKITKRVTTLDLYAVGINVARRLPIEGETRR